MPAVRVASLSEIPPGTAREVVAGGRILAIFNVGGTLRAVDGICPHAGGPLAEGQVTDGIVTCPWHGWQYDLSTGKNCVNPAISAGWGLNSTEYTRGVEATGLAATTQSWGVGLQWPDAFVRGNTLGLAVAQPPFATRLVGGGTPRDGNAVWEWWYRLQLTDQISVTPALVYLSRPLGADTPAGRSFQQLGGLVKTSFRF